jgi:protoporphyrinogen oxidase
MNKVAVLGAGAAGLAAASILASNKIDVHVYESAPDIGGLAKTTSILNEAVELGPHFFRSSYFTALKKKIPALENAKCREYERSSIILYDTKHFQYPPAPKEIYKNFSFYKLARYAWSFLNRRKRRVNTIPNTEDYLISKVGKQFYEAFFQKYIEKIWGCPASSLHAVFASGLLGNQSFSLRKLARGILEKKDPENYLQTIYPEGGFSTFWDLLADSIRSQGGKIFTGCAISSIGWEKNHLTISAANGPQEKAIEYDFIISTIPPPVLLKLMAINQCLPPLESHSATLHFRSLLIVYVRASLITPFFPHCMYVYDAGKKVTRITNLTNFREPQAKSVILCFEYWVDEKDDIWNSSNSDLMKLVQADAKEIACLSDAVFQDLEIKKMRNAFLIPELHMPLVSKSLTDSLRLFPNVLSTGRNLSQNFNYSMEDAIQDGIKTAEQVVMSASAKEQIRTV